MPDPHFFGYGSLVNRATHDYPGARHARLDGWIRAWCHTAARPAAYLTARPAPGCRIDGLIAAVPGADWAALDLREAAYDRVACAAQIGQGALPHDDVAVYAVRDARGADPEGGPILLSYLDVVVQGYLREFGEDGAARFFDTTEGWQVGVLDDRSAPRYPRHQKLAAHERAFVDDHLGRLSVSLRG
ncbi:MAG: gamma-glutamylcyclotransferase [Rhodobacteraceae bacterium]|nr:gamma-glutamylcyclotransferase [Paracoccaceae bacterium]